MQIIKLQQIKQTSKFKGEKTMNLKTQIDNFTNVFSNLIKETNMATKIKPNNKSSQLNKSVQSATDYAALEKIEKELNEAKTELRERILKLPNKLKEINVKLRKDMVEPGQLQHLKDKIELFRSAMSAYCAVQEMALYEARYWFEVFKKPMWQYGIDVHGERFSEHRQDWQELANLCEDFMCTCNREFQEDFQFIHVD